MRFVVGSLALLAILAACQDGDRDKPARAGGDTNSSAQAPGAAPDADRYHVRGRVVSYDRQAGRLAMHHEEIPSFRDRSGEMTGMKAMQMSFRVGKEVEARGLAKGDLVEFDFVVEWNKMPAIEIVKISKLPADTELQL